MLLYVSMCTHHTYHHYHYLYLNSNRCVCVCVYVCERCLYIDVTPVVYLYFSLLFFFHVKNKQSQSPLFLSITRAARTFTQQHHNQIKNFPTNCFRISKSNQCLYIFIVFIWCSKMFCFHFTLHFKIARFVRFCHQ